MLWCLGKTTRLMGGVLNYFMPVVSTNCHSEAITKFRKSKERWKDIIYNLKAVPFITLIYLNFFKISKISKCNIGKDLHCLYPPDSVIL